MSYDRSKRKRRRDLAKAKRTKKNMKTINKGYKQDGKRNGRSELDGEVEYGRGDRDVGVPGMGWDDAPV